MTLGLMNGRDQTDSTEYPPARPKVHPGTTKLLRVTRVRYFSSDFQHPLGPWIGEAAPCPEEQELARVWLEARYPSYYLPDNAQFPLPSQAERGDDLEAVCKLGSIHKPSYMRQVEHLCRFSK